MEETVPRLVMKEKIIIFANIKFIDCFIKRGLQRAERSCPAHLCECVNTSQATVVQMYATLAKFYQNHDSTKIVGY